MPRSAILRRICRVRNAEQRRLLDRGPSSHGPSGRGRRFPILNSEPGISNPTQGLGVLVLLDARPGGSAAPRQLQPEALHSYFTPPGCAGHLALLLLLHVSDCLFVPQQHPPLFLTMIAGHVAGFDAVSLIQGRTLGAMAPFPVDGRLLLLTRFHVSRGAWRFFVSAGRMVV